MNFLNMKAVVNKNMLNMGHLHQKIEHINDLDTANCTLAYFLPPRTSDSFPS